MSSMNQVLAATVALSVLALGAGPSAAAAQEKELIERGRETYEIHCSNCHGLTGKGDGELAQLLKIPPTDLTRIRIEHKGEFPWQELYRVVDGRKEVKGHGAGDMPVWGLTFQERGLDTNQEDMVRGRILQVLRFLDSIQVDRRGRPWHEKPQSRPNP